MLILKSRTDRKRDDGQNTKTKNGTDEKRDSHVFADGTEAPKMNKGLRRGPPRGPCTAGSRAFGSSILCLAG
jgi:hypothetical protein